MKVFLVSHEETKYCHNCGAAVDYHYCAVCGQATRLHVPSAGEFIHEFVAHYVALEGRLWKTLYFLLCKPGLLTAEYIAGRRVRYVEPLRVYLTFSILFFALLKLGGPPVSDLIIDDEAPPAVVAQAGPALEKAKREVLDGRKEGPSAVVLGIETSVEKKIEDFFAKPAKERNQQLYSTFFSYVPYAMFLLMPVFAMYLKLLYLGSGKRYGEHLLFALHTNAFAFCMFGLFIALSSISLGPLKFLLVLWLLFYLPTALRRVYGGSRWATALRSMVLASLHALSIAAALLVAFGFAVVV